MLADYPHDPLGLMPAATSSRPRVLLNSDDLARSRDFAKRLPWARDAYAGVLRQAKAFEMPKFSAESPPADLSRGTDFLDLAIAAALEENEGQAKQVIDFLHGVAQQYASWPQHEDGSRILANLHIEKMLVGNLAAAYDLCVELAGTSAGMQDTIANGLFRPSVEEICWHPVHLMCGNHHLAALIGSLSIGGAIGEPLYIHDAFYGHTYNDGTRSSGIAHQLTHDFLGDGMHWERTLGYHFFSLYSISRFAWIAERLGTDLWHRAWPATTEARKDFEHQGFDASGDKFMRDYFLAPLFMAHSDGSVAPIGDSSLMHIHELAAWGPLYEPAWNRYGDERFAWMLAEVYKQVQQRQGVDYQPRGSGDPQYIGIHNFVFVENEELPPGNFDLSKPVRFCLTGQHLGKSTLYPSSGYAVLRSDALDPKANNITFRYGPHHAGHQHPDLLGIVWECDGAAALIDPLMGAQFESGLHGGWHKQTVAHNTIAIDGISHRPQGASIEAYEIDRSTNPATGKLLAFASHDTLQAVAAETTNAWEFPVRLRRLLLVTPEYVFDRFEGSGEREHRWDYALHPSTPVATTLALEPTEGSLGPIGGMSLIGNLQSAALPDDGTTLRWGNYAAWVSASSAAQLHIGTCPSLPDQPNITLALTQHGQEVEYRTVFHRAALEVKVQSEAQQVVIEGDGFIDTISFGESEVHWQRLANGVTTTETIGYTEPAP